MTPEYPWKSGGGCPDPEVLTAYSLGKLPPEMFEAVATHLAGCPVCETALDLVGEEDSLIRTLRAHVPREPGPLERKEESTLSHPSNETGSLADERGPERTPPVRIGAYVLLEEIGKGGMGVVYKARQLSLNRLVALKLARWEALSEPEILDRLRHEGEMFARLEHDNIVRIYDCGEHQGRPYFSMEYVEGGSLAERLRQGVLPEREAADLVRTLARAVHFAHGYKIIHRDLKPANVLVGRDGVVKLTDFGLAKLLDAGLRLTRTYAIMGTAGYMAPEQARGESKDVGVRTDVYGLGAILYDTLTGRPPFQAATLEQTREQVLSCPVTPPSRLRPGLSPYLEAICLKCLQKESQDRYASAEELALDLDDWLGGRKPRLARPPSWAARVLTFLRRRRFLVGAAVLTPLALLGLVLVKGYTDPDRPLEEIERKLARGEEVVVLPEQGAPGWTRPRVPGNPGEVLTDANGTFRLKSWGLCLLEIVRDPRARSFRLSAEVKHEESDEHGEVGIYLAHRAYSGTENGIHQYVQLTYNDIRLVGGFKLPNGREVPAQPIPVLFQSRLSAQGVPTELDGMSFSSWRERLSQPPGHGRTTYRKLVVEVTPGEIRGFWDGKHVGNLSVPKVEAETQDYLTELRSKRPDHPFTRDVRSDFPAPGGLGLYVYRGSAAFRCVVVTPRSED
jgi:serine/threonine-protein kinase